MRALLGLILVLLAAGSARAGEVFGSVPESPRIDRHWVLYAHGFIVEGTDPRPEHPVHGVYDFPGVAAALAAGETQVVAPHRPAGIAPADAAAQLVEMVRALEAAGVPKDRITLIGFSRGGYITALANAALGEGAPRTVLLAACWDWAVAPDAPQLHGPLLSVYETSDEGGSCAPLAGQIEGFGEVAISTGLGHGAFYRPRAEWLGPVLEFIHAER